MKKLFSITLCALMAGSLVACSSSSEATSTPAASAEATAEVTAEATASAEADQTANMTNPWKTCESLEDTVALAGFDITLPDGDVESTYSAVEGKIIEVVYDANGDDPLVLRKGLGDEDLSGDYTTYDVTGTLTVGDITVNYKGESEESIHNATWTLDGYSYSIYSAVGATADAISAFVGLVK